jgi:DNA-binding transcriptional LysR family regulator
MDLRQLRNLLTVLETGSLRKAAEALLCVPKTSSALIS